MAKKIPPKNRPAVSPPRYSSYTPNPDLPDSVGEYYAEYLPKHRLRRAFGRTLRLLLVLILIGALIVGFWDARNISAAESKIFGTGNVMSLINSHPLATDSNGHVNMLVAGYSADDPGHSGANLTDSIMVVSMSPARRTGYMLSIPRDLYVKLGSNNCKNGYDYCKINEAYEDGGMPLLEQAVDNVLGININYYSLVDYSAVKDIVDAVGGIDVTINSSEGRLYDPNRDYTTHTVLVDLSNGVHHLSGQQALDLSRARGDTDALPYGSPQPVGFALGDYQRTEDQRMIFKAIKQKVNWKLIFSPNKNGGILNAIANNVKTNLPAKQALPFLRLFNAIPSNHMQSYSLNKINAETLLEGSDYDGSTQTPIAGVGDYSQIQASVAKLEQ